MQEIEKAYTQHAKEVYRYLLSLSHSEDLAEELTQETFAMERWAIRKKHWMRH